MTGDRPLRPHGAEILGLSDALWKMTECCWQHPPKERLKASEVVDLSTGDVRFTLTNMFLKGSAFTLCCVFRYVGSPNNRFAGVISAAQGLVGSGPTTPQTDAALSPRLLEILQYREQTHKRTLSDTTPLNVDRRTVAGSLPERPASTVGYQTPRQHTAGGIMQILDAVDEGRNSQPIPLPARSETPDTIESDVIWPTASTIPHQENLNQVPKSRKSTLDPPESTAITVTAEGDVGDPGPSRTDARREGNGSRSNPRRVTIMQLVRTDDASQQTPNTCFSDPCTRACLR